MLKIKIPNVCINEQNYILDVLLKDFLGFDFEKEIYEGSNIEVTKINQIGKLSIDTSFFHKANKNWLGSSSMPLLPLLDWCPSKEGIHANLVEMTIPILYGKPGLDIKSNHLHINLDIFGSAFFMLSRYEELVMTDRDNHDRFPAYASVAYKENFLSRPLINEYLEIFVECLNQLWPDLKRKELKASNFITCDVDWPFDPALYSFKHAAKAAARLLIKEKSPIEAFNACLSYLLIKSGVSIKDTYREAISWIMDVNEEAGNRVAFYFITHNTAKPDTLKDEEFNTIKMRDLFNEIAERGHEIGIHPGYETYNNPLNFKKSINALRRVLHEEAINQIEIGGRHHFLRWDVSKTPQLWEENKLTYDSTLSFADIAGFRCGICYSFPMYDIKNKIKLNVRQKPLIVMECSIIASRYEGLGYSKEAKKRFAYFKQVSHQFNGTFTLLWHNSHFKNDKDKEFYKELI